MPCGCLILIVLQDKTSKGNAQSTKNTIKEPLNDGQEVVDHWDERCEQTAEEYDQGAEEGESGS